MPLPSSAKALTNASQNALYGAFDPDKYDRLTHTYLPTDSCLLNYRKGIARARHGGAACRVYARGDSTTYGTLSGTNPNTLLRKDYVWHARARQALTSGSMLPGVVGDSFMQFANVDDTRFTYGGGGNFGTVTSGQTMITALESGFDTVDLCILRSGAAASVSVSGAEVTGSPVTVDLTTITNNTAGTFRIPFTSAAAHTFTITGPAAGTAQVLNLEPLVVATPPILKVGGVGVAGQTLATLAPASTGSGTNMEKILRQVPDLMFLLMGVNDMRGVSNLEAGASAYKINLQAFASAFQAQGSDVAFIVFPSYNSNTSGVASATESYGHHLAIYDVADQFGCAVIDLQRRWGYGVSATTGSGTTPVSNSAMYDGTHPTLLGYWDMGRVVARFLANAAG